MTAPHLDGSGARSRARARGLLRAVAVLALTFIAGLAVGWGVSERARHGGGRRGHGFGSPMGMLRGRALERLELTPRQRAAVDSIFRSRRGQIDAFWQGPGRQLRAIVDSTGTDVRAVLDSGQQVRFDSLRAEQRRWEQARRSGGPPHP